MAKSPSRRSRSEATPAAARARPVVPRAAADLTGGRPTADEARGDARAAEVTGGRARADEPRADPSAAAEPRNDRPAADQPRGDDTAADEPGIDVAAAADKNRPDRPAADQPRGDDTAADEPGVDVAAAADNNRPDRPAAAESGAGEPRADRAPAEAHDADAPTADAPIANGPRADGHAAAATKARPPVRHAGSPTTTADLRNDDGVRVAEWHDGRLREWQGFGELREQLRDPDAVLWVDLTDPPPEHVAEIARLLGLHPLVAEDILEGNQRAKIEVTDKLCHIVMFALTYEGEMQHTEIDFVLGDRFLLTVHENNWDPRATSHLREGLEPIIRRGPDHLLWALVDALVDSYFPFIDRMGDEIDEIEDQVVMKADSRVLARLFQLKKDLLTARRAAAPVREIFNQLTNRDLSLIDRDEVVYFRDVYDHLIRLTDELDNYRELVSSALDVYLSTVNNNLSLIMKRLTGVTVILAGIGAVAGIFGMSEAGAAFQGAEAMGFWLVTGFTLVVGFGAAAVLRRIGWI